jgi:hypothetical protein
MPVGMYIHVNIYNMQRRLIRPLGRTDAFIQNLGMNTNLYNRIKMDPAIEIYPVESDPYNGVFPGGRPTVKSPIPIAPANDQQFSISNSVNPQTSEDSKLDEIIQRRLQGEANVKVPGEVIKMTDEEIRRIAFENKTVRQYSKEILETMTKKELKKVLNIERNFQIGNKFYGGYHDSKEALMGFVLESQKEENIKK